jgi:flagellar M-ring protein FliF
MGKFLQQIKGIWARMETPQRAGAVLVIIAAMVAIAAVAWTAGRPDWRTLASGLDRAKSSEIAAWLGEQGVQYRLVDGETAVQVPGKDVHRLRFAMAEKDMLGERSSGFALLDKIGFGTSTHLEQRLYDRAVAGELESSFREIPGVRSARVIISRPQPTPFLREDTQPAISVKLDMEDGRRLHPRQLRGVTHLAAAAVEGASASRVQVMDGKGLLTASQEDGAAADAGSHQELRTAMEARLAEKAQSQLDAVLGPGRSRVSLSLDLDFTKRSRATSKPVDAIAIRTRTSTTAKKTPVPAAGGVAGTQPNVEGQNNSTAAAALAIRKPKKSKKRLAKTP